MKWFVILAIIFTVACEKKDQSSRDEDSLTQAYRLIDEGNSDEAITLLLKMRDRKPDDQKVLIALSSAYVRRAHIQVADFFAFAKALQAPETLKNQTNDQKLLKSAQDFVLQNKDSINSDVSDNLLNTMKTLSTILEFNQLLKTLPDMDEKQAEDLERAILNLQTISNIDRGAALYRAILRLINMKYDLDRRIYPHLIILKSDTCSLDLEHLKTGISSLHFSMVNVAQDLMKSYPSKTDDLTDIVNSVDSAKVTILALASDSEELNGKLEQMFKTIKDIPGLDMSKCGL